MLRRRPDQAAEGSWFGPWDPIERVHNRGDDICWIDVRYVVFANRTQEVAFAGVAGADRSIRIVTKITKNAKLTRKDLTVPKRLVRSGIGTRSL